MRLGWSGIARNLSPLPRKLPRVSTPQAILPERTSSMMSFSLPISSPSVLSTLFPSSVLVAITSGPGPSAVSRPFSTMPAPARGSSIVVMMNIHIGLAHRAGQSAMGHWIRETSFETAAELSELWSGSRSIRSITSLVHAVFSRCLNRLVASSQIVRAVVRFLRRNLTQLS